MLITFGVISLIGGVILSSMAVLKLIFSGSSENRHIFAIKLLSFGFGLMLLAVLLIHLGQNSIQGGVTLGVMMIFIGLLITLLGTWLSFWGPISLRNTNKGLLFILIGSAFLIISIILMILPAISLNIAIDNPIGISNIFNFENKMIGPIPFNIVAISIIVFTNGVAFKNNLGVKRFIGANLVIISMLIFVYVAIPSLISF